MLILFKKEALLFGEPQIMANEFLDAGPASDLTDGEMREIAADGNKVILLRDGDRIKAFSAMCPRRAVGARRSLCRAAGVSVAQGDVLPR